MIDRRTFLGALAGGLLAAPLAAEAQQAAKVPRIGYLITGSLESPETQALLDVFRQGLRERGHVEGRNILIEYRAADGNIERLPDLAGELLDSRDDPRKIREKVTGKVLTLAPELGPAVPALLALLDVPVDEASWHALDPRQRRQRLGLALAQEQAIVDAPEPEVRAELTHLQAAEFLYETRLFPDLEYTFKHALTHEVAYGGLLNERRHALHARIVGAIETLHRDRLGEHIERLAHHALQGELWDKAVGYLRQISLRAVARSANREAVAHLEQALDTLRRLPESRESTEVAIDLRFELRTALLPLAELARMERHLREAEALARALGDQRRLALALGGMVMPRMNMGDWDEAQRSGDEALAIAEALGDRPIELRTTYLLGMVHDVRGEFSEAAILLERIVPLLLEGDLLYERFGDTSIVSVGSLVYLCDVLSQLGRFDEAIAHAEMAVRIAETADHHFSLCFALHDLGFSHLGRGDVPRATRVLERCLDLCRTWQIAVLTPFAAAALGAAYAFAGRLDEALFHAERAVEEFRARMLYRRPGLVFLFAGMTYLRAGRIGEASNLAREALELTCRLGARGNEAHALCLSGDIASTASVEDAEGYYRSGLALAEDLGMRPLVARCRLGVGKLDRRTGKRQEAQEHLTTATAMFREMDMGFWLEQAEAEIRTLGTS